ncbi:MAG: HAD-superfamily hydrolase, subfamily variant 3 [Deltaproteobacteria bacterium]|jgi:HAD superfamily hydrolase (TIGR01509 family)|nr:HAD-superfamily hydrolase, subfamily variant 3 [Deltaproteobacteria bacterium]
MIQAILFDSDGVLVDTERLFFDATRTAFESAGVSLSDKQWARWYLGEGRGSREIAEMVGIPQPRIEAAIAERDKLFWARIDEGVPIMPGVEETIEGLAHYFRLAIVTGASRGHFDRVHASTGLRRFFQTVVTSEEYERAKPHPQAYLTAMERLGLNANEYLAVEDSPRGAAAAVAAGIRCVVIPTTLTDVVLCPAGCTFLDNMTHLLALLELPGTGRFSV